MFRFKYKQKSLMLIVILFIFSFIMVTFNIKLVTSGCCLNTASPYLCQDVSIDSCCSQDDLTCKNNLYTDSLCNALPECKQVCCCIYDNNNVVTSQVMLNISCSGDSFPLSDKSCSDICEDHRPTPVAPGCTLNTDSPTNPLSDLIVTFDYSSYPRKIILSWNDVCNNELINYKIYRKDEDTGIIQELETTFKSSYIDTSFNFSKRYDYIINATYDTGDKFSISINNIKTGDIECWLNPPGQFCIDASYYLKYMGYFGYSDQKEFLRALFNDNEFKQYRERIGNGYFCNNEHELMIAALCNDDEFCVKTGDNTVTCSKSQDCTTFNYDLGINPDKDTCDSTSGCYFDEGVGLTGLCLSCNAPYLSRTCYSYRSKYACEHDNCNFAITPNGCEWISINDDLGLGFCIDSSNINCGDCNLYLEDSPYTTCEDLYNKDPRFSKCAICGLVKSCTNYTSQELCEGEHGASIDPKTHIITPSGDFCGLGACQYFPTIGCVKNIDLDPTKRDCTVASELDKCEQDVYPPEIKLINSYDLSDFTLNKQLHFVVTDRINSSQGIFLAQNSVLPEGYAIYICSGSLCNQNHLSWKEFHNTSIYGYQLYDILNLKTNKQQIIKYFIKDRYNNVGVVQVAPVTLNASRVCHIGDTRLCPKQKGVCKNTIQHCIALNPSLGIGYYAADCNVSEYNITGKYELIETSVDALDNDCDGLIDETAEKEVYCNGIDDDHDGLIDEGWPDFDGDNNNALCDYNNYIEKEINGKTYRFFKIKSDVNLSDYGYMYEAKYCGADCVDLDSDNDGIIDYTFTGEIVDKDNRTPIGCKVYRDNVRKGIALDSDNDGICDGLDHCVTLNPSCKVYDYSSHLSGCPTDCRDSACLGDPYCKNLCECNHCDDFYGAKCDYSKCTLGCGCYYDQDTGTCLNCSTVKNCEDYQDAQSCRSNSCDLLMHCEWSDDDNKCYTDSDGDGLADLEDPCPYDSLNDYDNDGYCQKASNKDILGKTIVIDGKRIFLKGGYDCDDYDNTVYPRDNFSEGYTSLCNNKDDDCDGLIDEDCPCINGDYRSCGNSSYVYSEFSVCKLGIQRCINGSWSNTCFGFVGPQIENEALENLNNKYCDGWDNDCNGLIDDKCSCLPGQTIPCGTDLGICRVGYRKCGPDLRWETTCFDAVAPKDEICGDYLDNDCDGSIDEGCPCVEGQTIPCPDSTPYVFNLEGSTRYQSACKKGYQICVSGVWSTCQGFKGPEVLDETPELNPSLCDSKDNDCDGLIDEGCGCFDNNDCRTNCGWGTQYCEDGVLSSVCDGARQPSEEVKGDGDEDCDGLVDEGFKEDVCDGKDGDNDGWVDDGFPDFDGDNDPRICDFSKPIVINNQTHFRTKDGLFWCGADCVDLDKDNDGLTNDIDQEPATPIGCKVDKSTGISLDSDNDGICDGIDECEETLDGCPVQSYNEEHPGCPKNCADPRCIESDYCKCSSCDACETSFSMPTGCDSLHCSYCGDCALSYDNNGTVYCDFCSSKHSCSDYINQEDCEANKCLTNTSCVWNGTNCLTDSDGDGLADLEDPCPYDSLNDQDNDGYCEKNANPVFIQDGRLQGSFDCNDSDPTIHIGCGCILDFDNDGYGDGCLWGPDCNDRDPTKNTFCENGCKKDMDGDGYGLGCSLGPDCDDYDASKTTDCGSRDLCFDGILDGNETDIDCGGSDCNPCDAGKHCIKDSDCKSNKCNNGLCYDEEKCNNGIKDDFEVDVDCGGPCEPCDNGMFCTKDDDCKSLNCIMGECKQPTCDDMKQNQDETDVDCGGLICKPCENGKHCLRDGDCQSHKCDLDTFTCISIPQQEISDSDNDGIPDDWEKKYNLNASDPSDAGKDYDDDGLTNLEEYELSKKFGVDLNPKNPDTDADGIPDGKEVKEGTNPTMYDVKKSHTGLLIVLIILILLFVLGYFFKDKIRLYLNKYNIKLPLFSSKTKGWKMFDNKTKKSNNSDKPIIKIGDHKDLEQQHINIQKKEPVFKPKISERLEKKIKEKSKIFDEFDTEKDENDNESIFDEFNE